MRLFIVHGFHVALMGRYERPASVMVLSVR